MKLILFTIAVCSAISIFTFLSIGFILVDVSCRISHQIPVVSSSIMALVSTSVLPILFALTIAVFDIPVPVWHWRLAATFAC
jgi:hypothetical protein